MRIMIESGGDQSRGLTSVFRAVNHEVYEWDKLNKPAFDAFDEFEPQILLCLDYRGYWERSINKCLSERNGSVLSLSIADMSSGDIFRYGARTQHPKMVCDVGCLLTKDVTQDKFDELVMPLINQGLNVKLVGEPVISVPQYLGNIGDEALCDFYASSKVCLVLSKFKPVYDAYIAGTVPIAMFNDTPIEFEDIECSACDTVEHFHNWINKFVKSRSNEERSATIKKGREVVYNHCTYWHEAAAVLANIGLNKESDRVMEVYSASQKF